ncbi:ATP-binding protein [Paracraurococcus lichenis]|uniref:Histidine kinase/HSP90-like ATPase domain-containing protein n=1 Tax=Paracraurococcus lichenis TaxID=3064888 RepID=A0ABT9ECY4_9PROT|nr:ATP-binding protein [Paracraurococcus sp. LOR1-02]MDO9714049.1 hypothetical protein [Paracraurococcus sp. LOR1-02]
MQASATDADFRQLRHQTKNALQRILLLIEEHPALQQDESAQTLAADLQRRITLVAAISDALFGFTQCPEHFVQRLRALCEGLVMLLGSAEQAIRVGVLVAGRCPSPLEEIVLRVAHEFVGNAVKHGMYARNGGRIDVRLDCDGHQTRLTVTDDGWGYVDQPAAGEGLSLASLIAAEQDGTVTLSRRGSRTQATLLLPYASREGADRTTS